MRILFVSNNFPPEVNALATRLSEHGREWVRMGHEVEVVTDVPNFPEGEVYAGYENRLTRETVDGMSVTRVPMYVAENRGTVRRTLSYLSFMASAMLFGRPERRPDVVVASSPQMFTAVAGLVLARRLGVPFVLEVRDLWPESIVAVGAMERNAIIRAFEALERYLYRAADHIVVVTDAFERALVEKGVPPGKISVLKNGMDLETFDQPLDEEALGRLRREYDLEGKFVASYIGTIGMAHRADILLEAARRCNDPDTVFLVVGTGAERERLAAAAQEAASPNFRLVPKQPKEMVPYFMALTDVSVVHLRRSPLFETVLPSKLFEAMGNGKPVVLGVEGEAKETLEAAEAGIAIPPEDADALAAAVAQLRQNPVQFGVLAENGRAYVRAHHDRRALAHRYAETLARVAAF